MHMRSVIKKVAFKNTLYFVKYKKDKFLTVNSSTQVRHFISLLSENLSFLYFLKYKVFLNETFLCTLLLSKSIYIFNHIIFKDIKVWGFKKFQKTKSDESTGAHVHKTFSVQLLLFFQSTCIASPRLSTSASSTYFQLLQHIRLGMVSLVLL
jgi:hypothetical protein